MMSITLRLTLTYLVLTLSGMLLLGVALTMLADQDLSDQGERELRGQAEIAAALLSELAATPAELQAIAPGALAGSLLPQGNTVRVFSPSGALLVGDPALGPFPSRPALALVQPPFPLPASQAADRQYTALPIPGPGASLGVIEISRSTAADSALLQNLRRLTLQAAAVAALAIALISLVVARTIARPVVRLTRRAELIAATVREGTSAGGPGGRGDKGTGGLVAHHDETAGSSYGRTHVSAQLRAQSTPQNHCGRPLGDGGTGGRGDGGTGGQGDCGAEGARDPKLEKRGVSRFAFRRFALSRCAFFAPFRVFRAPKPPRDEIAQLAASLDQLERQLTARMARIGELEAARARFYRSVSHELRTPLTALRGALENLADRAPEEEQAALSSMEAEVLRLSRLVDELLRPPDDGRLLPAERRLVDLGALAADLCALLEGRAARAGVALRCDLPAGLTVAGDRDRLKQALLNLLDNALRVTPAGGHVLIDGRAADRLVRVQVVDSGPGVPADQRALIWERGQRGGPATAGSAGLGLAIVGEIVAAHGGRAYLDDHDGAGACFVIELPRA